MNDTAPISIPLTFATAKNFFKVGDLLYSTESQIISVYSYLEESYNPKKLKDLENDINKTFEKNNIYRITSITKQYIYATNHIPTYGRDYVIDIDNQIGNRRSQSGTYKGKKILLMKELTTDKKIALDKYKTLTIGEMERRVREKLRAEEKLNDQMKQLCRLKITIENTLEKILLET